MAGYIGSGASVVSSGAENKKVFDITTNTTSLTGLNYTVGKVHVYHNGVRLVDGTDYTATNSTSITLTVAAVSGDQVVVVSYASFQVTDALPTTGGTLTGDLTVQGTVAATAYTGDGSALTGVGSPSIDDNGNATAITIDSSENVLANTTSTSVIGNGGFAIKPQTGNGTRVDISNDGEAMLLDGAASGPIIGLYGNGTTVGSIATQGSRLSIGSGDVNLNFNASANSMYPISDPAAGTLSSGIVDLGAALATFKDAYLSGGVYLGGTGSANKLGDFEEGNWTPTQGTFGVWNSPTFSAKYTKIGRKVTLNVEQTGGTLDWSANSYMGGLPFAPDHTKGTGYVSSGGLLDLGPIVAWSQTQLYFTNNSPSTHNHLIFAVTYLTNS